MNKTKTTLNEALESQLFQAVRSDREITHAAKDPKRKASVPSQFALEFDVSILLDAMLTSKVSLQWMVKTYKQIADNKNETGASRMAAIRELRRLQAIGATTHPKIKRFLNQGPTTGAVDDAETSSLDPFSKLQAKSLNLKVSHG